MSRDLVLFNPKIFEDNPEPRCALLLILDTSYSMTESNRIGELHKGVEVLKKALQEDALASLRVDISIIDCSGSKPSPLVLDSSHNSPWVSALDFSPPALIASGATPLGQAASLGIEILDKQLENYRQAGIGCYKPWTMIITDGHPTDSSWESAASKLYAKSVTEYAVYVIGVTGADLSILGKFSARPPVMLKGLAFQELFLWISQSMKAISRSSPGEPVKNQTIEAWADI